MPYTLHACTRVLYPLEVMHTLHTLIELIASRFGAEANTLPCSAAVHTMAELKLSGNHLKGSRPVLSFDKVCSQLPLSPPLGLVQDPSSKTLAYSDLTLLWPALKGYLLPVC